MKGMIFTEFLDMVETNLGLPAKDRILQRAQLASGGSYTAVGDYDYAELGRLVAELSAESGVPVPNLLERFGEHLFALFTRRYMRFFESSPSCFDFLGHVEDYIHVEVRKLYPRAELPSFSYPLRGEDQLVMEYRSPRPFAALATGLILAAIRHFREPIELAVEDLSGGVGTAARYTLTRTV